MNDEKVTRVAPEDPEDVRNRDRADLQRHLGKLGGTRRPSEMDKIGPGGDYDGEADYFGGDDWTRKEGA